jgi:hypothetical protein
MLGGELRWEEQRLPRARMCVDRAGTVDDMSEGFFACLPPRAPARPEAYMRRDQVDPVRPTQADQPG